MRYLCEEFQEVSIESIINVMSTVMSSLPDKLEELSLHCRSFTNGLNSAELPTFVRL